MGSAMFHFSVLGILHWDILQLYRSILDAFAPPAELTGLPAWASTLGDWTTACWTMTANCWGTPVHYRDARTEDIIPRVLTRIPA